MEFPVALTNAIQQLAARYPMAQLKNAAEEISRRYRQETGRGKTLLRGELEAAAYALARMPATLGAVAAALEYTLEATDFAPKTLLDVGAGTGAACWAADALLPLEQVTCLEREAAMRQLGQELMREGSETLQEAEWLAADLTADAPLPKAELVVASYVLGELSSDCLLYTSCGDVFKTLPRICIRREKRVQMIIEHKFPPSVISAVILS